MSTEESAKTIFTLVRERYKSSLVGSSNKKYDLDAEIFADAAPEVLIKKGMRNLRATLAHERRGQQAAMVNKATVDDEQTGLSVEALEGKQLWNMHAQKLNCDELTKMWCWKASEIPINACYAAFGYPGDHALCIVGQTKTRPLEALMSSVSIKDYKGKTGTSDAWIVDVWLNTVCHIADYPQLASKKLDDWSKFGKRITFTPPGEENETWAPPGGDYKTIFMNATMSWG